jgi:predicted HicB family RNase H-like nuclease
MSAKTGQSSALVPPYVYRVVWSPQDDAYVATAVEWGPGLSWIDADACEALRGLRALIDQAVADHHEDGRPVPESLDNRAYNGKVLLRMPSSLHRSLTIDAAEEGVSVNQLAVGRLSAEVRGETVGRLIAEIRTEHRDLLDRLAGS